MKYVSPAEKKQVSYSSIYIILPQSTADHLQTAGSAIGCIVQRVSFHPRPTVGYRFLKQTFSDAP
jgi:hypothetical protein